MSDKRLNSLNDDWSIDGDILHRQWAFKDFAAALAFVNAIGAKAEDANHHPDLELGYGRVVVRLTTHDAGGLTDADFSLANTLDGLDGS